MANEQQLEKTEVRGLPAAVTERGIAREQWNTLCHSLFPGAKPASVVLVWDYCKARKLDPMKKPCHIVPMRVKGANGQWEQRDVVMPGIYEYRTTAQRTLQYLGHEKPVYGEMKTYLGVEAPEWCDFTVYRWHEASKTKIPFSVRVYFREVVATTFKGEGKPAAINERWTRAPIQMMTKCAEAAALRAAFPDELGGEATVEEMDGRGIGDDLPTTHDDADPLGTALSELSDDRQALAAEVIEQSKLTKGQLTALFLRHGKDVAAFMLDLADQVQKAQEAKKPAPVKKASEVVNERPVEKVETPNAGEIF